MRDGSAEPDQHPGLVAEQYRDERRLQSRYALHKSFSTAKINYLEWIFDQLFQGQHKSILDLGCGPGYLWQHNLGNVPEAWSLYLGDPSPGMLARAQNGLMELSKNIEFIRLEGQQLPFTAQAIEAVLALHVLHLLEDPQVVINEIKRVLVPGGKLYAGTNGHKHMLELHQALEISRVDAEYFQAAHAFSVQEGHEILREFFEQVECILFEDALEITQVSPLLAYAESGVPEGKLPGQRKSLERLEDYWELELRREGAIYIQKQTALFIAW
jgi:ubiquinone/menaquinone biosynthesis C-methylase UbiE